MSRFAPALRRVARELDVPSSVRSVILLEMMADLEALYERHRLDGAGEEEAMRRAEEMVLGSADVVRRLGRIHRGSWRVWSEGMGGRLGRGADLALLALAVAPVLLASTLVSLRTLATSAEPLALPLIILAVAITVVIALEAGRIMGGGRGGTDGLPVLFVLAALGPAVGLLSATLTAWSATRILASPGDGLLDAQILARVGTAGALLLAGLLLGIAAGLTWFVLLNRAGARAGDRGGDGAGLSRRRARPGIPPGRHAFVEPGAGRQFGLRLYTHERSSCRYHGALATCGVTGWRQSRHRRRPARVSPRADVGPAARAPLDGHVAARLRRSGWRTHRSYGALGHGVGGRGPGPERTHGLGRTAAAYRRRAVEHGSTGRVLSGTRDPAAGSLSAVHRALDTLDEHALRFS